MNTVPRNGYDQSCLNGLLLQKAPVVFIAPGPAFVFERHEVHGHAPVVSALPCARFCRALGVQVFLAGWCPVRFKYGEPVIGFAGCVSVDKHSFELPEFVYANRVQACHCADRSIVGHNANPPCEW